MRKSSGMILAVLWAVTLAAQDHHHDMNSEKDSSEQTNMCHAFSLNLPMERDGSGTGWMPDAAPMYGHGAMIKEWMLMFHNNIFIRYNKQDVFDKGTRGGEKFDVPSWFMLMAQRPVARHGLFHARLMISPDPFTVGREGYPRLFQTGEAYQGRPLVDKQHPHDFFSELSVAYTQEINKRTDVTLYIGYPGEPALGPVAFMHRLSALNNPDAPLGHHWQDATHITFGVATLGLRYGMFKIEGSSFTGREPGEHRYDFDKPRFDSWSARLSANPGRQLAMQVSHAYIHSPEELYPEIDKKRSTASVIHHLPLPDKEHYLSTALVWGMNDHHGERSNSFLLEPSLQMGRTAVYGRFEWIQKSAEELVLEQYDLEGMFVVKEFTLGANYRLFTGAGMNVSLGAQGSLYVADTTLDQIYGRYPVGAEIYLRIFPVPMHMHHAGH